MLIIVKNRLIAFVLFFSVNQVVFTQSTLVKQIQYEVDSLIKINRSLVEAKNYEQALELIIQAKEIAKMQFDANNTIFANLDYHEGRTRHFIDDFSRAKENYKLALSIWNANRDTLNSYYVVCLQNLASIEFKIGEINLSRDLYTKAKRLHHIKKNTQSIDYAKCIKNIAMVHHIQGQYDSALVYYNQALELLGNISGPQDLEYITVEKDLGAFYRDIGEYDTSEKILKEVIQKLADEEKTKTIVYSDGYDAIGLLYYFTGFYEKAQNYFRKAIEIMNEMNPHPILDLTNVVGHLALLKHELGDFGEAEDLYLNSLKMQEQIGIDGVDYAANLNNLGGLFMDIGNFQKALTYFEEATRIIEKSQGKDTQNYSTCLTNLGNAYLELKDFKSAEQNYLQSVEILKTSFEENRTEFATSLGNLSNFYFEQNDYSKAVQLEEECLKIRETSLGKNHPDYALSLHNLGTFYLAKREYCIADSFLSRSLQLRRTLFGSQNPECIATLIELSKVYEALDKRNETQNVLEEISQLQENNIKNAVFYLSEFELSKYALKYKNTSDLWLDFCLKRCQKGISTGRLSEISYDDALIYKGFLLNSRLKLRNLTLSNEYSINLANELKAVNRRLAAEYSEPISNRNHALIAEIEEKSNTLEKQLAKSLSEYRSEVKKVKWIDIRDALGKNELAIEFVNFKVGFPVQNDSIIYAALVVSPGCKTPEMIPLFEKNSLDSLLKSNFERRLDYVNSLYSVRGRGTIEVQRRKKSLYDLIWKPIIDKYPTSRKIYFSPVGLLNRINMDAISVTIDKTLADLFDLVQLGSTRQISNSKNQANNSKTAMLLGGINYDLNSPVQSTQPPISATRSRGDFVFTRPDSVDLVESWEYLPFSAAEIHEINKLLTQNKFRVNLREGNNATEEYFKSMVSGTVASPSVLHIATHGYFFADPKQKTKNQPKDDGNVFKISDHPLIRSGLLLAGANAAWQGKQTANGEDGILTAYEISQLNLSNTELVILSACETGLGDIQGNEGVYGLQRAFKVAGAKYLIMSLWQVPDHETKEFMEAFYKNWLDNKMDIPAAFRTAQKQMRERFLNPFQWAGFVLVE